MKSSWWLHHLVILSIAILTQRSQGADPASANQLPQVEQCGRVHRILYKRLVGGHNADAHTHPWAVYIFVEHNLSLTRCGGALIDKQWVLSSAQCFITGWTEGNNTYNIQAVAASFGKHNLTIVEEGQQDMVIPLTNIFRHRDFNGDTMDYNIALLKLPKPVEFSDTVQPICLPSSTFNLGDFTDDLVTVLGWGLRDNGKRAEVLQESTTYVISTESCKANFSDTNITINDRVMCMEDAYDALCAGDSGSPIEYQSSDGTNMVIAIDSLGRVLPNGTCSAGTTTGGSYIPAYINWINQVTGLNYP